MQSQLSVSNISILDMAVPPLAAAFPKRIVVMLAGIGSGISLGIILALVAEAFDRRIRVVSDLEFAGSVHVLGTLPKSPPARSRRRASKGTRRPRSFLSAGLPAMDTPSLGMGEYHSPSQSSPRGG